MLHLCCFGRSPASIGFVAEADFFENHELSLMNNVDDIACLNEQNNSEWSSVLYQIGRGKYNCKMFPELYLYMCMYIINLLLIGQFL